VKKIFSQLLIIFMCMPYLACAMSDCGHEATIVQTEAQPCADHDQRVDSKERASAGVMFLPDCAGVDVQLIAHGSSALKVDFKNGDAASADHESELFKTQAFIETTVRSALNARTHLPPDIILTTQRFRL